MTRVFMLLPLFALRLSLAFWTYKRFQLAFYLLVLSPQSLAAKGITGFIIA